MLYAAKRVALINIQTAPMETEMPLSHMSSMTTPANAQNMDIQPVLLILSLYMRYTPIEVDIGVVAHIILPVDESRVSRPRLKNMKYSENPVIPAAKNQSRSFLQNGFLIPVTIPITAKITAARIHLMAPRPYEPIWPSIILVKGKPEPHNRTVKNANK